MNGDRNGLSIPYHGMHVFLHIHIYNQPIFPISKSISKLHPQTPESSLLTHEDGSKHINYHNIHDSINKKRYKQLE